MEYVYAVLLLNSTGAEVNEENVEKVMKATGKEADKARIKALIASLEGVNIEEAIQKQAAVATAPAAPAAPAEQKAEEEEEEEEEEVSEEEAASGLGSLFD